MGGIFVHVRGRESYMCRPARIRAVAPPRNFHVSYRIAAALLPAWLAKESFQVTRPEQAGC